MAPWGASGKPWLQLVLGAELGVDSFFFLSGLLVTQMGYPEIARRKGRVNLALLVIQRYLRLTPAFATTMLFYAQARASACAPTATRACPFTRDAAIWLL